MELGDVGVGYFVELRDEIFDLLVYVVLKGELIGFVDMKVGVFVLKSLWFGYRLILVLVNNLVFV